MSNLKVVVVLLAILAIGYSEAQLQGAALVFRHGERTPGSVSPKYGRTALSDEIGLGQLTLTGSRQLYDVGVDMRNRYLSLFDKSGYYRLSNMYVMSSPYPRAITSLTSFMAGFAPPPASDKTIPFRWQSFPFVVDNEHRVVIVEGTDCPVYMKEQIRLDTLFDATFNAWYKQDKAVIDRVANYVGEPLDNKMSLAMVADMLRVNAFIQPSTPGWLIKDYENTIAKYLTKYYFGALLDSDITKRFAAGNMIDKMVTNMIALRDGTADAKKLVVFSGHDISLTAIVRALGVESQVPDIALYGDTVSMELYKTASGQFEVQLWYISNTAKKPFKTQLTIPNCGKSCPLDTFYSQTKKWFIRDWNQACAQ